MKLYAIVEVDDELYDEHKEWCIVGDDLTIKYEEDGALMNYKMVDCDILDLKPLPKRLLILAHIENGIIKNIEETNYMSGWNDCLEEITGGKNEASN